MSRSSSSSSSSSSRTGVVELTQFSSEQRSNLDTALTRIGQDLQLVANETNANPNATERTRQLAELTAIQTRVNAEFDQMLAAILSVDQRDQSREMAGMEQEERRTHDVLLGNFNTSLSNRINTLINSSERPLTYGQQAQLLNNILMHVEQRLTSVQVTQELQAQTNHAQRISDLAMNIYTVFIEQIAVTLTNVYQIGPALLNQLMSIIITSGFAYNLLGGDARNTLQSVPYFGRLFSILNTITPNTVMSAQGTVGTLYYLLRNSGINLDVAVGSLRGYAAATIESSASAAASSVRNVASAAASSAGGIIQALTSRLSAVLTSQYNVDTYLSDDSQSSSGSSSSSSSSSSISSSHSVDSTKQINASDSQMVVANMDNLLSKPYSSLKNTTFRRTVAAAIASGNTQSSDLIGSTKRVRDDDDEDEDGRGIKYSRGDDADNEYSQGSSQNSVFSNLSTENNQKNPELLFEYNNQLSAAAADDDTATGGRSRRRRSSKKTKKTKKRKGGGKATNKRKKRYASMKKYKSKKLL